MEVNELKGHKLISQSEYARRVGKHRATVRYYVREGKLKTKTIGTVPYIWVKEDDTPTEPSRETKEDNR